MKTKKNKPKLRIAKKSLVKRANSSTKSKVKSKTVKLRPKLRAVKTNNEKKVGIEKTTNVTKISNIIKPNRTTRSSRVTNDSQYRSSSLAPVQRQTLEFLRNFLAEHGFGPTLKDIALHIGVKSISTAHFHLERLEDKGFIRRGEDGMIELVDISTPELGPTAVPLVGTIAAGMPIEAIENMTMIDIPTSMIDGRGEVYCLEVSGDSMIDAHICDGDIVVIKKQDSAENGQIVVALLEDGTATLKTYRRLKGGKVMLIPANPTMSPMTLDGIAIQGRLIGVLRQVH